MANGSDRMGGTQPKVGSGRLVLTRWLPLLAYVALVFILSAQPNLSVPGTFRYRDKVMHLLEYGPLGFLLARALRATLRVPMPVVAAIMAVALGILVGATDETIQRFTPGRESSIYDVAADTVGLTIAQFIYLAATRERRAA